MNLALAAFRPDDHQLWLADKSNLLPLSNWLSDADFSFVKSMGERNLTHCFFPTVGKGTLIWLISSEKKSNSELAEEFRRAGCDALSELNRFKIGSIFIKKAGISSKNMIDFIEGMSLASYQFLKYFSKKELKEKSLQSIFLEKEAATETDFLEINAVIEAVFDARTLVNEPQNVLDTPKMVSEIERIGQESGFSTEVLGKEKIESLRMGGLLSVNRASTIPPAFLILEYKPIVFSNKKPIVLVGKGVVYDTGGLSIKTSDGMEYMKSDMAGAATVVGAMSAVAKAKLPVHIIGLIPATDNKIGENALAPGDIITISDGTTVEVVNTDAEGRLILADALHYAKKLQPELVLDFATLTGSAVKALGNQAICYMGNAPKSVKDNLESSGWAVYERLVELPLWKEFGDEIKSNIADLKNLGGSTAGMITAGKFLEHFVDYPWLHFDIAGPAWLKTANSYRTKDGTGVGVRLLFDFLKKNYC
jgi:leucyl aminopeptidase